MTANVTTDAIEEDKAFEVQLKDAVIEFPKEVVDQMKAEADVAIDAGVLDETAKEEAIANLDEETKEVLSQEGANIYSFEVTLGDVNEGQKLSNFDVPVIVTLPYTLGEGEEADGIVIWYVGTNGELEAVTDVTFRDEDGDGEGTVVFEVSHFSYYAVAYRETAEMRCRRGNHDFSDVDLWEVILPDCDDYGYTTKKCAVCGTTTIDSMVVASGHDFGEKQQPNVNCDMGGYVYDVCETCGLTRNYEYVPALGHTVISPATCDSHAICSVCHAIVVPAKGHAWTEWEIVSEPTDVNPGLKRRYCPRCGEIESIKLAATGNVTPLEIETYEDLISLILEGVFNFGSGTLDLTYTMNGQPMIINVKVEESDAGHEGEIKFSMGTEFSETMYYRNGVIIMSHPFGEDVDYGVLDMETLLQTPMSMILNYMEQYFEIVDAATAEKMIAICDFLAEKAADENNGLDDVLAEYGSPFTVAELSEIMNSVQTVYAYIALKMGYATNAELQEGVEVPTKKDWHNVLDALTTATDVEGGKQYQWNATKLLDSVDALLTWIEEHLDSTYAEVLYELLGDEIVKSYPNLTDWDKLIEYIAQTYPGTKKVEDLIGGIITLIEQTEICTMDELYAMIDAFLFEQTGQEISTEEMVQQYAALTLDELAAMMMGEGATVEAIYGMLDEMMTTAKLGDLVLARQGSSQEETLPKPPNPGDEVIVGPNINGGVVSGGVANGEKSFAEYDDDGFESKEDTSNETVITVATQVEQWRAMFDSIAITAEFSITLDESGNLIGMTLNQTFGAVTEDGTQPIESIQLTIANDATVTVTLPDEIPADLQDGAQFSYDAQGNLIISGLPADGEVEIGLDGYVHPQLKDVLTYNADLSKAMGYDVYVLDAALSSSYESVGQYIQGPDGKIYTFTEKYESSYRLVTEIVSWSDFTANPEAYLPTELDAPVAYYLPEDVQDEDRYDLDFMVPVYNTVVGHVYQLDGEWYLINRDASKFDEYYYIEGRRYQVYHSLVAAPYVETVESFVISNTGSAYYTYKDGEGNTLKNVKLLCVTVATAEEGDSFDNNVEIPFVIKNGEILLLKERFVDSYSTYTVGSEISSDVTYDRVSNYSNSSDKFLLADGTEVVGYKRVTLSKKVKNLYVAYDGQYFNITNSQGGLLSGVPVGMYDPFVKVDVSNMETITLPDGRVLYVLLEDGNIEGTAEVYGYIHVKNGAYVMTACKYVNNELQQIKYAYYGYYGFTNAQTSISVSVDSMLQNEDYITENADGTYTVSGEMIELIKSYCMGNGDVFTVNVFGMYENGDTSCLVSQQHVLYFHAYNLADQGTSDSFYPDWYDVFRDSIDNDGSMDESFSITVNDDGTVSVKVDDDTMIDIEFEFVDETITESDVMIPNEEKSEETGLEIYTSGTYRRHNKRLIYLGGKYYDYYSTSKYVINDFEEITTEELLLSVWNVQDLDYRFDEVDENQNPVARVYYGYLRFECGPQMYNGFYAYFQIIDGQLYILTGVSDATDVGIRYEGKALVEDYLESLRLQENTNWGSFTEIYLESGASVKGVYYALYDGDRYLCMVSVPTYVNATGERKTILINDYTSGMILVRGAETTLPAGAVILSTYTNTDVDGKATTMRCVFYVTKTETDYVRAGDRYLEYERYLKDRADKHIFLGNLAELEYIFGVLDENGEWKYYANAERWTSDYDEWFVLSDAILVEDEMMLDPEHYDYGKDENGNSVYQFKLYSIDHLLVEQIDGMNFYYQEYNRFGYLEMQDGYYIPAELVETADGGYTISFYWEETTFWPADRIEGSLNLRDYITFDGNEAIISAELMNALADYPSVGLCIISYYSDGGYKEVGMITYDELAEYFSK